MTNVAHMDNTTAFLTRQPQETESLLQYAKETGDDQMEAEAESVLVDYAARSLHDTSAGQNPEQKLMDAEELQNLILEQKLDSWDQNSCHPQVFFGNDIPASELDCSAEEIVAAIEEVENLERTQQFFEAERHNSISAAHNVVYLHS